MNGAEADAAVTVVNKDWSLGLTCDDANGGGEETCICNERVGELDCESDDLTGVVIKEGKGGIFRFSFDDNDNDNDEDDEDDDDETKTRYSL